MHPAQAVGSGNDPTQLAKTQLGVNKPVWWTAWSNLWPLKKLAVASGCLNTEILTVRVINAGIYITLINYAILYISVG